MSLNVGSRIAHYDVTALIGEGGMGRSAEQRGGEHAEELKTRVPVP